MDKSITNVLDFCFQQIAYEAEAFRSATDLSGFRPISLTKIFDTHVAAIISDCKEDARNARIQHRSAAATDKRTQALEASVARMERAFGGQQQLHQHQPPPPPPPDYQLAALSYPASVAQAIFAPAAADPALPAPAAAQQSKRGLARERRDAADSDAKKGAGTAVATGPPAQRTEAKSKGDESRDGARLRLDGLTPPGSTTASLLLPADSVRRDTDAVAIFRRMTLMAQGAAPHARPLPTTFPCPWSFMMVAGCRTGDGSDGKPRTCEMCANRASWLPPPGGLIAKIRNACNPGTLARIHGPPLF